MTVLADSSFALAVVATERHRWLLGARGPGLDLSQYCERAIRVVRTSEGHATVDQGPGGTTRRECVARRRWFARRRGVERRRVLVVCGGPLGRVESNLVPVWLDGARDRRLA